MAWYQTWCMIVKNSTVTCLIKQGEPVKWAAGCVGHPCEELENLLKFCSIGNREISAAS